MMHSLTEVSSTGHFGRLGVREVRGKVRLELTILEAQLLKLFHTPLSRVAPC